MEFRLVDNRYKIAKKIGEGAMGRVYKVFDIVTERIVALKEFSPREMSASELEDFKAEFSALTRLRHPNLVEVYEFGVDAGVPYFTMEYVEGQNLLELLPTLTLDEIYAIIIQVAWALAYVHSRGTIHHDVKTVNIMVAESDFNRVKLMDFGLARERTQRAEILIRGTVEYMAPEMVKEIAVDHRVDLYSLGVVLYELTTGQLPFRAENKIACIKKHLEENPRPPQLIRSDIPLGVEKIILKLLAKDPNNRFATANEVIAAIAEITGKDIAHDSQDGLVNYVVTTRFIGREQELLVLNKCRLALENRAVEIPIVMLEGENGVGKQRLLNEFKTQCQLRQIRVFQTACHAGQGSVYEPIIQLTRSMIDVFQRTNRPRCLELLTAYAAEFSLLIPDLMQAANLQTVVHPLGVDQQLWLIDQMTQFFIQSADDWPYVLAITGIQWADTQSLQLLRYLARNIQGNGPLIVLSWTVDKADFDTIEKISFYLLNKTVNQRIVLENLGEDKVTSLLTSMFGEDDAFYQLAAQIFPETKGNPEYIFTVIKTLIEEKVIARKNGRWVVNAFDLAKISLPDNVVQIIKLRLSGLTEDDLNILNLLAVTNYPVTVELLKILTGYTYDIIIDSLQRLIYFELVKKPSISQDAPFSIASYKTQRLLYQWIEPTRRAQMHRTIADKLEQFFQNNLDAQVEKLAYHYVQANEPHKARHYAFIAGKKAAALFAHQEAIRYFKDTQSFLPINRALMIELLHAMADVYAEMSQYHEAITCLEQLIDDLKDQPEATDPLTVAYFKKGKLLADMGSYDPALAVLKQVTEMAGPTGAPITGRAYNEMARIYKALGNYSRALDFCQQSHRILKNSNQQQDMMTVYFIEAELAHLNSASALAITRYKRALVHAEKSNNLPVQNEIYNRLGEIYYSSHSYKKALTVTQTGLAIAEKLQNPRLISRALNNLGVFYYRSGKLQEALNCWKSALDNSRRIGDLRSQVVLMTNLRDMMRVHGKYDIALHYAKEIFEFQKQLEDTQAWQLRLYEYGDIYYELNDFTTARKYFDEFLANKVGQTLLSQFYAYLINAKIAAKESRNEAETFLLEAIAFAVDQKMPAQAFIGRLLLMEYYLRKKQYQPAYQLYELLSSDTKDARFEQIIMLTYLHGALDWAANLDRRAGLDSLKKALTFARKYNYGRYKLLINGLIGEIYLQEKQLKQAHRYLVAADRQFHQILTSISDGKLRQLFACDAEVVRIEANFRRARQLHLPLSREIAQTAPTSELEEIDLRHRYHLLKRLIPALKNISATLDTQTLFVRILDQALELTRFERGFILLANGGQEHFRAECARSLEKQPLPLNDIVWDKALVLRCLEIRMPLNQTAVKGKAEQSRAHVLCAPLSIHPETPGAIYLEAITQPGLLMQDDLMVFAQFSEHAATMIQNAFVYENAIAVQKKQQSLLEELHEVDLLKASFIGKFSQDIRTPLTSIIANADILAERSSSADAGELFRLIREISSESHSLLTVVNKVLRTTLLDSSDLSVHFTVISGPDLMGAIVTAGQKRCATRHIHFSYEVEPSLPDLFGSRLDLLEVFEHLFDNAARFTEPARTISLTIQRTKKKTLLVAIADQGQGIKPSDLSKVFMRFFQSNDTVNQGQANIGLGLTIARQIIHQHQGQIWVESMWRKGTTVFVELPYMDDYSLLIDHFSRSALSR